MEAIRVHPAGITLAIRAKPGARRTRIVVENERLVVEVAAPPVEGKANEAICAAVAKALGVRARQVTLLQGEMSRDKVLLMAGVTLAQVSDAVRSWQEAED